MRSMSYLILLFISLILFLIVINTLMVFGLIHSSFFENRIIKTISSESVGEFTGYAFLIEDSVTNIEIITGTGLKQFQEYAINITFIHLSTNKKWTWSLISYSSKPLTPKFIAPCTGLYKIIINFKRNNVPLSFNIKLSVKDRETAILNFFYFIIPTMVVFVIMLLALALVDFIISKKDILNKLLIVGFKWELQGNYRWIISLLYTILLVLVHFQIGSGFSPMFGIITNYVDPILPLYYYIISPLGISIYWILPITYIFIIFLTTYSYEDETGIYREYILFGINRFKLFIIKILSGTMLSFLPFMISNTLLILIYSSDYLIHRPEIYIHIFLNSVLIELFTYGALLSITLIILLFPFKLPYKILFLMLVLYIINTITPSRYTLSKLFIMKYSGINILDYIGSLIPYLIVLPFVASLFTYVYVFKDYH